MSSDSEDASSEHTVTDPAEDGEQTTVEMTHSVEDTSQKKEDDKMAESHYANVDGYTELQGATAAPASSSTEDEVLQRLEDISELKHVDTGPESPLLKEESDEESDKARPDSGEHSDDLASLASSQHTRTTSISGSYQENEMHDSGVSSSHDGEEHRRRGSFSTSSTSADSASAHEDPVADDTLKRREDEAVYDDVADDTLEKKTEADQNDFDEGAKPKTSPLKRDSKRLSFSNALKVLRRIPSRIQTEFRKSVAERKSENAPQENPLPKDYYAHIKVESLPQLFVTKCLGKRECTGLWGLKHVRGPVDDLVNSVKKMKKGDDLPLAHMTISNKGIDIAEHPKNKRTDLEPNHVPIEFISYGVQDAKFHRIFALIVVKEMSSKVKKTECHAYVCDSPISARRMALSLALGFKEYKKNLNGKHHNFHVQLKDKDEEKEEEKSPLEGATAAEECEV